MPRGAAVLKLKLPPRRNRRHAEVKIGDAEVKTLKSLVEYEGLDEMAKVVGVSNVTLLRVCAGWFDRCNIHTQQAIRAFFAESDHAQK